MDETIKARMGIVSNDDATALHSTESSFVWQKTMA
jgi:hypothetical protein